MEIKKKQNPRYYQEYMLQNKNNSVFIMLEI